nr:HlyD family type I secretion periplasmic adaptor subunit [Sphingomonas insulae]
MVRSDEVSFLPAALEIIERPVSPTARATTWTSLILLVLAVAWLVFGRVDIVASAQGRLIPADHVKLIQPAEAGVVRAILVYDGQLVRRGQPLVELDPTVSAAEAVQARRALEAAELDAARARALLSALDGHGLIFNAPQGTSAGIVADQTALARARLDDILATAAGHAADRQAAVAARGEADIQAAKLSETLPLLDEQVAANEQLLAKGFVSKLKVIEMRRQRLAAARDRDMAVKTSAKAAAQITQAGSGMDQSRAAARALILTDLTKADADVRLRREELTKAAQRSSLRTMTSPADGTIAQLAVHTVGGVVEPAQPIMVVVPSTGAIVAEVSVLNKDVGFVRAGQSVAVKLEAFPFTRYGTLPGRVRSISSDAVEDPKLGLVYTARISLDRTSIDRDGTNVSVTPGMAATADIRTGTRRIVSYLLSPINEARKQAGRER